VSCGFKNLVEKTGRLVIVLVAAGLWPASSAAQPPSQIVWFAPLDPMVRPWVGYSGSVDYLDLFTPSAAWSTAASHVQVFKIYASLVDYLTDDQLRRMFADLDRRGIALAAEFGPLTPENCGFGVEGFDGVNALHLATRIRETGGTLRYIAMDEPFYFAGIYSGDSACHWPAQKIAANAVAQIGIIRQIFPDAQVGDIEPFPTQDELDLPGWAERFRAWFDAWKTAAGKPLAFFHSDLAWGSPAWRHGLDVVARYAAERGIPFGIIYNGLYEDQTDADWVAHAEQHFVDYETHGGAPPDHVIFQSWNARPRHLLPEGDPSTFTHLIDRYFRARTQLTLTGDVERATGKLTDSANHPMSSAAVQLSATPLSGSGVVSDYVLSGIVPNDAKSAVIGIRVNLECGCQAASDIALYSFRYFENNSSTAAATLDFSGGLNGWGLDTDAEATVEPDPDGNGKDLHIIAQPAQHALLNSAPIPVVAGAPYTLHISARVSPDSVGSGYFTIIFLKDVETSRKTLAFGPAVLDLGTINTAVDGSYGLNIAGLTPDAYQITAQYSGSDANWPAAATFFVQLVPVIANGGVVNAAHYRGTAVSPGEIVTIFGSLMGGSQLSRLELNADDSLASELSRTRVLFDGVAAPLVYASSKQISAIVPYAVAARPTTQITVEYQGSTSSPLELAVVGSAPGLFTLDSSGSGPAAALNQDYSLNTGAHPESRGSIVMLYATGEGQTDPAGVDGRITGTILARPLLTVSVSIGGVAAEVTYAGGAPGLVAGVLQVNARVPASSPAGPTVPVILRIGAATSQAGATIAVK